MMQFYDQLCILIKPTEACNLRCIYCFNKDNGYCDGIMNMDTLEKLYSTMFPFYKSIAIVWHGGEPTFVGTRFYKKALELEAEYAKKYDVSVKNSMQTNATLLTDDFIDLYEKYHFSVGISYDGVVNDYTRNSTTEVLSSIKKLQQRNIRPGVITVVSNKNIDLLIDTYNQMKSLDVGVQFNHYIEMNLQNPNAELSLDLDHYVDKMYELYLYWFNDRSGNVSVNPFTTNIEQYLTQNSSICIHSSCLRSWMCMDYMGNLSPCDKLFPEQYRYGNINDYSDIRQVYYTDGYKNLLGSSVARRKKCIADCSIYKYCQGGCNHSAMVEGDIENNGGFSCLAFQKLFTKITSHLDDIALTCENIQDKVINPYLRDYLINRLQN